MKYDLLMEFQIKRAFLLKDFEIQLAFGRPAIETRFSNALYLVFILFREIERQR